MAVLAVIVKHLPFHPHRIALPPTPVSPLSPTPTVLPLAQSRASLEPMFDKPAESRSTTWSLARDASAPMLLIALLFPVSTALVAFALSSLPISGTLPRTLADLAQLVRELQSYSSESGTWSALHVLVVLSVVGAWKHAWSIPGSVLLNILAGALLNPYLATLYMTLLTAVGSILSTLLAAPLAPLLAHLFPKALALTRGALQGGSPRAAIAPVARTPAWVRLSILRLIGVVPWSGINVACGVCGVALTDCFLGAFLGTMPWTAVTVQVGDILQGIATVPSSTTAQQTMAEVLASPAVVMKLIFLTLLSLAPILARDRLRSTLGQEQTAGDAHSRTSSDSDSDDDSVLESKRTGRERGWPVWINAPLRMTRSPLSPSRWSLSVTPRQDAYRLSEKHDAAVP